MHNNIKTTDNSQHATEYRPVRVHTFTDVNAYYYSIQTDAGSNNATKADIADRLISKYKNAWDKLAE